MPDWKRFRGRRLVSLALPRLMPLVAPRRVRPQVVDDSDTLTPVAPFLLRWPANVERPRVGLAQDTALHPYWTKYRRFLQTNGFTFRIVDMRTTSWLDELEDLDMIVWRPSSELCELEDARRKIFFLQDFLGLPTYPSLRGVNLYEDKILQSWVLRLYGVETPTTVASCDEADALKAIAGLGSEVVWKLATGSASSGV
jgi:hypothetical protein